jgi:hypothetical protein
VDSPLLSSINRHLDWVDTVKELVFVDEVANAKVKQSSNENEWFHDTITQTKDQDENGLRQEHPETKYWRSL